MNSRARSLTSLQVRSTLGSWKEALFWEICELAVEPPGGPQGSCQEQPPGGGPPRPVPVQPLPTLPSGPHHEPLLWGLRQDSSVAQNREGSGPRATPTCAGHSNGQGARGAEEGRQRRGFPWPTCVWSPAPIGVRQRHGTAQDMVFIDGLATDVKTKAPTPQDPREEKPSSW